MGLGGFRDFGCPVFSDGLNLASVIEGEGAEVISGMIPYSETVAGVFLGWLPVAVCSPG